MSDYRAKPEGMSDYRANLASPADAIRRQLVLQYVLPGAVALSTLVTVLFARAFLHRRPPTPRDRTAQ
jgi:hypothetical protein